ncbi:MAG TPA: DMT family transporter [Acidimicrobiales bacterium]|nr:DMT family transporter [Acidimicrobiales bacterium]
MMALVVRSGFGVFHHHVGRGLVSIVLLSLASAAAYGLAAVLQHQAAIREPPELSLRAGLLVSLARRPLWLVGNAFDGVGYLFQFLALRRGSLALVEPLLVLSLVFALPVAAWLEHRRASGADVASTCVIAAGLALFLGVARPGIGHPHASGVAWVILSAVIAVCCGAMVLGARGGSRRRAAVLLAAGSGTAFGYVAAVTERTGHILDAGVVHTLMTWAPYALLVGGVAALLLTQSAFHAGALRLSLPTLTVAQPLVAVAIGLGFFGEHVDSRGAAPVFEFLGLGLMTMGVFFLARSPLMVAADDVL